MQKIIVFTDTHMQPQAGAEKPDPDVQLKKGITHVNEFNGDADLVVFCGDLTDKGDVGSYEMLKERLADLNIPYKLLLGNHDNRENFLTVFNDVQLDENGFVQQTIDMGSLRLILLDTLHGPPYDYPSSHMGKLCERRLEWLDAQLASAGEKDCIIFMHHPPHNTGFIAMDTIKLIDGSAFYNVVKTHDNVSQLVCGHVHRTISGHHKGIPFAVFKSTVGQMPMLFDVMDFHMEVNEPASYGILFADRGNVLVQTEDFELSDLKAVRQALQVTK